MEVDSVHALIEKSIRTKDIYSSACYISLIKGAKKKNPPYQVKYLDHTLSSDFSSANFYSSIRPGISQSDPMVVDLSQLKYDDDDYKLEHTDGEWILLPQRMQNVDINEPLRKIHKTALPITLSKWKDLQSLKSVILII